MQSTSHTGGGFDAYWNTRDSVQATIETTTNAIGASLNPRIPHEFREQARLYLEEIRVRPDAPYYGFSMANDVKQTDAVRYYGLQLLEQAIRYKWSIYEKTQKRQLLQWVKSLADGVRKVDKGFIRNKIAQIWVEMAKRYWGEDWTDMDESLVALWKKHWGDKDFTTKLLVLYILETLSEDTVNSEDAVAGLRTDLLGNAMNDIMAPSRLYRHLAKNRNDKIDVRCGEEGWLNRMCSCFAWCLKEMKTATDPSYASELSECAVKTLRALQPTVRWMNLKGLIDVNMVDCFNLAFHMDDVPLQVAAAELLYAVLSRPYVQHSDEAWYMIQQQALQPEVIALIKNRFESIRVWPGEDDEKYLLQKKLSEMISVLADVIAIHPQLAEGNTDMPTFFQLLLSVLQNKSLVVSIPVLHSWKKLLGSNNTNISEHIFNALGVLVQTCSARLIRYESVSEADAEGDETFQFLFDDFDTMPERHAFLGNYRRYCFDIIQAIAHTRPNEALDHVLEQMRTMLETGPYTFGRGFESATYTKSWLPILQFEAQYQVVSSTLKGYHMWLAEIDAIGPDDEMHAQAQNDRDVTTRKLQQWSYGIINMHIDDPEVAGMIMTTLVTILKTAAGEASFILHVVQHLLTMQLYDNTAHDTFSEAVKSFESQRVNELQRLALAFPNQLLEVYHELEPRITVSVQKHSNDPRLVWGYRAFLFIIVQRARGIERNVRVNRLREMLKPIYDAWASPPLSQALLGLQNFCQCLDLGDLPDFYRAYRFVEIADWSSQQLDDAGQARQNSIKSKIDALPLRMTKTMLTASTDKLKPGTDEYDITCELWSNLIMLILPCLVEMLKLAQAFSNMANWSHLPADIQAVIKRTLQDRFWQSGISNESKDEFYARISGSKTSYEGFASVVRGTMRNIREQGYHILYLMAKFDEQFFGHTKLSEAIADAVYTDAASLSPNHLQPAINLTTGLVQRCPPHYRASFLPPLLRMMFVKMDAKISSEWEAIDRAIQGGGQEDELGDEMRLESVLRQLTHNMVNFVPGLLEFEGTAKPTSEQHGQPNGHSATGDARSKPTLSQLVLSDTSILEPMMLFCTHALRMRDTRCCTIITKVFRALVPLFVDAPSSLPAAPAVREFISSDVLKACIASLHEPYFTDMQRDLAALIAQILLLYSPLTSTPRSVLLSLPDMPAHQVDAAIKQIVKSKSERQQRSLVLELLDGLRGVSIAEAGKISRDPPTKRKVPAVQARYMEVEQQPRVVEGDEVGLENVAGMFGDA